MYKISVPIWEIFDEVLVFDTKTIAKTRLKTSVLAT